MKREKFLQNAKLAPSRIYRNPSDIFRDRRLTDPDRLEILDAWEREAAGLNGGEPNEEELLELRRLRSQLKPDDAASAAGGVRP